MSLAVSGCCETDCDPLKSACPLSIGNERKVSSAGLEPSALKVGQGGGYGPPYFTRHGRRLRHESRYTPARMRLDLGCGRQKMAGYLGLDRFSLPGVDVAADLDLSNLPLRDDSFDVIYAFHLLEHVADLQATMKEVWRVAKPGAQVRIGAP
jgi:SAM-dependent methyltransferase